VRKRFITVELINDLDGRTLEECIEKLTQLLVKHPKDAIVDIGVDWDSDGGPFGYFNLNYERALTPEEVLEEQRLAEETRKGRIANIARIIESYKKELEGLRSNV
jgi:hypothetical protein